MARLSYEVVDGKARWGQRTLAEWVPEATRTIADAFAPRQIILFGSVARGDDTADSDVDLLVIFDEISGRRRDLATEIQRALADIGAPVDVIVTDRADLDRRAQVPGVLRMALRDGQVVHDRAA